MKSPGGADLRTAAILEFYREKDKDDSMVSAITGVEVDSDCLQCFHFLHMQR